MTRSPTTNGEPEIPQPGIFAPVSDTALRDHTTAPVRFVEHVHDSGRTECVHATIAEGGRRARTGTANRFLKPSRIAVSPHRFACAHVIARDDLIFTALLLRIKAPAADRKR